MSYCSTAVECVLGKGERLRSWRQKQGCFCCVRVIRKQIPALNSSSKPSQPSKCAIVEIKVLGSLRRGSGGEEEGLSMGL
ncbi:hypothetical protein Tco_0452786 [Tanacetum coccineum]